jgi:hypothetical protein
VAKDELLRLTGTSGNPLETVTTTANGTAVFVGTNRVCHADELVTGTVTGTGPTLDVIIQLGTSTAGTFINAVSFPQVTTDMGGSSIFPGSGPNTVTFQTDNVRGYVRVAKTVGGTTPSFAGVRVDLRPTEPGIV